MFIIGIILGAGVVVFVLQNIAPVAVSFLSWQFEGSLAVIFILAVLAGMVISWLLLIPSMLKSYGLKSHNQKLQKDLDVHKQKLSETEGKLMQAKDTSVVIEKTVVIDKE